MFRKFDTIVSKFCFANLQCIHWEFLSQILILSCNISVEEFIYNAILGYRTGNVPVIGFL